MKIKLTESQLKKIIKESVSQRYMDYLLDKISEKGMDSLTPDEKEDLIHFSQGRNVEKEIPGQVQKDQKPQPQTSIDGDDFDDEDDEFDNEEIPENELYTVFISIVPEDHIIKIKGKPWHIINQEDQSNNLHGLLVTNGNKQYVLTPFWNGQNIKLSRPDGKDISIPIKKNPSNIKEMKNMIVYIYEKVIPLFITSFFKD